ncbi:hypothetical protein BJ546DRAFT_404264 [Cryomyces antarcticus]
MTERMIVRRIPRHVISKPQAAVACRAVSRRSCRRYSSSSSTTAPPAPPPQSAVSMLGTLTNELDKLSPRFDLQPAQIQILQSPSDFYETLKVKISRAQRRIYLSTLYIGKTEHELISTIRDALQKNPDLKVSFLTDALRGTRESPLPSCASLLAPLVADFGPERVEVRMFHTPNLTGLRKKIVPKRINEGWGLQHMKLYGIDDEIIISGANLSDDYFTNRQDRYHVFSSKEITDYFSRIHEAVSSISFKVSPNPGDPAGYLMEWPSSNVGPSPLSDPKAFVLSATSLLTPMIKPSSSSAAPKEKASSTSVYPLLQLTPLLKPDTSTELPALTAVLRSLATPAFAHARWTFTAGYFNMTPEVRALLLATQPARATVVAASPWANGFYGSKGISGLLPSVVNNIRYCQEILPYYRDIPYRDISP